MRFFPLPRSVRSLALLLVLGLSPHPAAATVERLLAEADALARRDLPYVWGGADLSQGGLDCSGFMIVIFKNVYGISLPDESGKQFEFLSRFGTVIDARTRGWDVSRLRPGDLVFMSGTRPSTRPSPITHVMMYVRPGVLVGAQDIGWRIGHRTHGVGYFNQTLVLPSGDPSVDVSFYRKPARVYAYVRLDHRRLAAYARSQANVQPQPPATAPPGRQASSAP